MTTSIGAYDFSRQH